MVERAGRVVRFRHREHGVRGVADRLDEESAPDAGAAEARQDRHLLDGQRASEKRTGQVPHGTATALCDERELTLRFSIGDPTADAGPLLDRMARGELDPTRVITHRMPLSDAAEAYRLFDSREATKVVLRP